MDFLHPPEALIDIRTQKSVGLLVDSFEFLGPELPTPSKKREVKPTHKRERSTHCSWEF